MRITFTWQPDEWHEAVQLATTARRRRRDFPMMVYGVIGVMSLGAVGDLFQYLQSRQVDNPGGDILLGGLCTAAAGSGLVWLTRTGLQKRRLKRMPPVPAGEQQVTFQETGWSITPPGPGAPYGALQSWQELSLARSGTRALVAVGGSSTFAAVPLRALTPHQAGHLQRMLARKLKPSAAEYLKHAEAAAQA